MPLPDDTPFEAIRYPVAEIFESLQGEGANTGLPAVFLRFGKCNLACPWCDTDHRAYEVLTGQVILDRILPFKSRSLILTGGEPLIQRALAECAERLKQLGYWIALETNGLTDIPQAVRRSLNYVAASPKAMYADLYADERMLRHADEVRVVADGDVADFCRDIRRRITAPAYFLTPCDRAGRMNIEETIRQLGILNQAHRQNKWLLSVQAHKLAGIR
ncbi:MAG: 7-carboxy-7-deazaguanine synthase QueE [Kiritimatiellaeota bacterium]|nr:7-carboxy-7-deazaguanine synthase QueE [Kiritimatiellota bacterium]